ncbi:hypothetical protein MRB53_017488 [Persea americana]|uniref:Uncharacterized protein n=1 Tax=Persea americana TaxID=3435 RepID=A0ACC2M548_PERAE|nr:hypothetical protein MRB53_017488 [Persea americana]
MEDPIFIDQCEMNILDQFTTQQMEDAFGEEFLHSFTPETYSSYPPITPRSNNTYSCSSMEASPTSETERPTKQMRTNNWDASTTNQLSAADSSSPAIISFCKPNSPSNYQQFYGESFKLDDEGTSPTRTSTIPSDILISQGSLNNQSYVSKGASQASKRVSVASTKRSSYAQDHIIAERKRREKLSQRFIALSAVLPCLKKTDKASILGDAIKFVKQLQERVKTLEETAKKTMESVVFVKKSQIYDEDNLSSPYEHVDSHSNESLPEIEVRVYDQNILIRIHCKKQKGLLVKTLAEIEKFQLSVINTNVMPFSSSALDITVIAQMEDGFSMTPKDLGTNLSCALSKFT